MLRLAGKMAAMTLILAVLQMTFGVATDFKDTPTPVRLCDTYLAEDRPIIYFGDSSVFTFDPEDTDQAPINAMLQRHLPEYPIGAIAHDAYHLELYAAFADYLARQPHPPRLLVVPINMGTFSPLWGRRPAYQFARIELFLRHPSKIFRAYYRPLAVFRAFNLQPFNQDEFEAAVVYDGEQPVGHMADYLGDRYYTFSESNLRDRLLVRYMGTIGPEHPKVIALRKMAARARAGGMQVLFYITPVDYEAGNAGLGPRFEARIRQNAAFLEQTARGTGATCLNLALDLPAEAFWWGSLYPNEHMNETGRAYVAGQLAAAVRALLEQSS